MFRVAVFYLRRRNYREGRGVSALWTGSARLHAPSRPPMQTAIIQPPPSALSCRGFGRLVDMKPFKHTWNARRISFAVTKGSFVAVPPAALEFLLRPGRHSRASRGSWF